MTEIEKYQKCFKCECSRSMLKHIFFKMSKLIIFSLIKTKKNTQNLFLRFDTVEHATYITNKNKMAHGKRDLFKIFLIK